MIKEKAFNKKNGKVIFIFFKRKVRKKFKNE